MLCVRTHPYPPTLPTTGVKHPCFFYTLGTEFGNLINFTKSTEQHPGTPGEPRKCLSKFLFFGPAVGLTPSGDIPPCVFWFCGGVAPFWCHPPLCFWFRCVSNLEFRIPSEPRISNPETRISNPETRTSVSDLEPRISNFEP